VNSKKLKHSSIKQWLFQHHLDVTTMPGLSKELQQKILKHKPSTIAQAALISGMTPAVLSLLILKLTRKIIKYFKRYNNG
jgi:tRNA uridine 5-carboxymethylaminomethyl modification enzyme